MIEIKQAVASATEFIRDIYGGRTVISGVLLEEVELSADDRFWLITLGFYRHKPAVTPLDELANTGITGLTAADRTRVYKVIKIDADTGKPVSMKMREVSAA